MIIKKQIEEINSIFKEADNIYRNIAKDFGLSDCAFWILYILNDEDKKYSQNDIKQELFFPKQTINSTINKLKKEDIVTLEAVPNMRNIKNILLTKKGKKITKEYINIVKKMEYKAFANFSIEEREMYIKLTKKHIQFLNYEHKNINININKD